MASGETSLPVILLKLGGSLITRKEGEEQLRAEVLARLAAEIAEAWPRLDARLVLGHGSGSFGHRAALAAGFAPGEPSPPDGIARVQRAADRLHRQVLAALDAADLPAFSLSPRGFLMTEVGRQRLCFLDPLLGALEQGLLPVVHGDAVMDRAWGAAVASTETVFLALGRRLARRELPMREAIWVGETDGVLDDEGQTIAHLDSQDARELAARLGGAAGPDVTGGIRHRLEVVAQLARLGVPSILLDGSRAGEVARALLGEPVPGTRISPSDSEG